MRNRIWPETRIFMLMRAITLQRGGGAAVLAGLIVLAGCRDTNFPDSVQALVQGIVTVSAGTPAEGATVVFEVTRSSDSTRLGIEPATTDALGRYSALLAVFTEPFEGSMTARASWEMAGAREEATITGLTVPFRRLSDGIEALRVDIALAPVSGQSLHR